MDRREQIALLPYTLCADTGLLDSVPEELRPESWWLILRDGTPISGHHGGGVLLLSEIRLTRPLGRLLKALHLSGLLDALDVYFARQRSKLSSIVPKGPAPCRFP